MVHITSARKVSALKFISKRIKRIVPLYWLTTAIVTLAALVMPTVFRSTSPDVGRVLLSLFFIAHWHATVPFEPWPILIQGWTLNFEMWFYLIFALWLIAMPERKYHYVLLSLAVFAFAGVLDASGSPILKTYTSPLLLEFAFGMLLRLCYSGSWLPPVAALGGLLLLSFAFYFLGHDQYARPLIAGGAATVGMAIAIWFETRYPGLFNRVGILLVADASYAIYLTHVFALGLVRLVANGKHYSPGSVIADLALIGFATCLAIAGGIGIHKLIERPIMERLR